VLASKLLLAVAPPLCVACRRHAGRTEPLCRECRRTLRWLEPDPSPASGVAAWAPLAYEGPARAMVAALKFGGALALAGAMATQMAANAPSGWLESPSSGLVPVPLHPARRRRRGFNQAERLAVELAARSGRPVEDCLERAGPSTNQVGRGREERSVAIAGAVRIRAAEQPPPVAVLVDDVITTGATLAACAKALRRAGPCEVRAVAYARTPGR